MLWPRLKHFGATLPLGIVRVGSFRRAITAVTGTAFSIYRTLFLLMLTRQSTDCH